MCIIDRDKNASSLSSGVLLKRAVAKGGRGYNNAKRDVVDAVAEDSEALSKIPASALPSGLQSMSKDQRAQHVEKLSTERKEIQAQIAKLNRERNDYIAKQRAETKNSGTTLGDAFVEAVQAQLKASGFEVSK